MEKEQAIDIIVSKVGTKSEDGVGILKAIETSGALNQDFFEATQELGRIIAEENGIDLNDPQFSKIFGECIETKDSNDVIVFKRAHAIICHWKEHD